MSDELETQQVVEVDWGPNDLLVVTTDRHLSAEQRESLRAALTAAASGDGRKALVLDGGLSLTVLHKYETANQADEGDTEPHEFYMDGTPIR